MSDNSENGKMSRRKFLKIFVGGAIGIVGAGVASPLIGYFLNPTYHKKTSQVVIPLTATSKVPVNSPILVSYQMTAPDGWITQPTQHAAWVVTTNGSDYTVFNPHCTHLGCLTGWNPGLRRFECPCHGSTFDINGKVLTGPAANPLEKIPFKINKGVIQLIRNV